MNDESLRRLLESTNAIPWEADAKTWRFTYVGPQAVRLLGYSWAQWYEDGFWKAHIHEEDRAAALTFCQVSSATKDDYEFEYRMVDADGKTVWIHDLVNVVRDGSVPQLLQGFMIDITERKEAARVVRTLNYALEQRVEERTQELRASEAQFEQLLSCSPAVIYRCKTEGDYRATFVSENVKQLTGYEAGELVDDPAFWGSRIHSEDKTHADIGTDGLFKRGRPSVEYRVRHQDGAVGWVRDERILVRGTDGAPIEIVGCWVDITESKEAADRLLRSESNLAQAQRLAHLVNYEFDVEKQEVQWSNWSDATFRILGRDPSMTHGPSREQPTFEQCMEWVHPEDREVLQEQVQKAIAKETPLDFNYRVLTQDGATKHIRTVGQPIANSDGEVTKIFGTILDMTESRKIEQDLQQTKLSLQSAVKAANIGLWDLDLNTNETFLSPEWKQQLGYEDDEIANSHDAWERLVHPDDRDRALAALNTSVNTPYEAFEVEYRLRHKDGSFRWILSRVSLLFDTGGNPWRLVGAHIDITSRRQAEQLLQQAHDELEARVTERTKELEEINESLTAEITERKRTETELRKMSEVFMHAADPIIISDLGGTIIDLNAEAERAYGWTRQELLGQPFRTIVPPEKADELEELQLRCRRGATIRNFDGVRWTKQGRRLPVLTTLSLLTDEQDNPVAVASIAKDISELKRTEKALRESEERLRLSAEATELSMWDWNILTDEVVRDERTQSLHGLVPEGYDPTLAAFVETLHPGDRERVSSEIDRSVQLATPLETEFRVVAPNGNVHWLLSQGRPYRNDAGQVHRLVGTTRDITKRKRAEILQATHNRVLELLAKGSALGAILSKLALSIEGQHQPGIFCSILLLEGDVLRHGAAPNLAAEYTQAIDGVSIGPRARSCGTAAFRKERVIVADIMNDPLWEDYRELARQFDLAACWSELIQSESGKVLGTFAMYFGQPDEPTAEELNLLREAAQLAGIAIEHTNAKRAVQQSEAALRESHSRLQELTGQLIFAQEEAYKRLARELHDDFSQRLAGLLMEVSLLEQKLPGSSNGLHERVRGIGNKIGTLAKDINGVSRQLHSSVLDNVGLAAALEAECDGFSEREGIVAKFNSASLPKALPEDISLCLYRIAQESLRNIAKHANASSVQIDLTSQANDIILGVQDSGDGFDVTGGHTKGGLGLVSMEERVRPLGGSLLIESEPGKGTQVEVRIPCLGVN